MFEYVMLLGLLLVVGGILLRYAYWTIDRELADLARAAEDPDYRRECLRVWAEAAERRPNDARAWRRWADGLWMDNDTAGARKALTHYLTLAPDDAAGWGELAEAWLAETAAPDPAAALAAARKALDLDAANADYTFLAGLAGFAADQPAAIRAAAIRHDAARAEEPASAPKKPRHGAPGWPPPPLHGEEIRRLLGDVEWLARAAEARDADAQARLANYSREARALVRERTAELAPPTLADRLDTLFTSL